jgi:small-conductance mechanosensitive channel
MNETLNQTANKAIADVLFDQLGVQRAQYIGLEGAAVFLAIVLGSIVVAKAIYWVLEKYVKSYASKTKSEIDDLMLKSVHLPLYYGIMLLGLEFGIRVIDAPQWASDAVSWFVSVAVLVVAAIFVADLVCLVLLFGVAKSIAEKTKTTADDQAIPFLAKILRTAIYAIAAIIILDQFHIEITPLVASLGIAGFAIGFAAQDTIGNLLAGFFILSDRPFTKGDRIQIRDYIGEVVDIGLRTTKIETLDNTYVIVPNAQIISNEVINYALPDVKIKLRTNVGVAYGTDPKKVREILTKVAGEDKLILKNPPPEAYFLEFGESSLNFQLVSWIEDFHEKARIADRLNTRISEEFKKAGVEIPFPTRTLYIKKES